MSRRIVGVAVVGKNLPDFPPLGSTEWPPDEFRRLVELDRPHWIWNLAIEPTTNGFFCANFTSVTPADLETLCRCMGLSSPGLTLRPLEFIHGELPSYPNRSPYAFGLPASFAGRSATLGVAVGVAATVLQQPLPPWVILSGVVHNPFDHQLELDSTGDILEKVRLAFGRDPGFAVLPVLDRLYRTPSTVDRLGAFADRVSPDKLRLFITSALGDAHPPGFDAPLTGESLNWKLDDFQTLDDLDRRMRAELGTDLLYVQVPTVFHALRLLGYHVAHPLIQERVNGSTATVRFFRVRHARAVGEPPLILRPDFEVQMELAWLEKMLGGAKDCRRKLQVILDRCLNLLHCQSGDICIRRGDLWLEVFCREHPGGPGNSFIPSRLGITGHVIRQNGREIVADTSTHAAYLRLPSD